MAIPTPAEELTSLISKSMKTGEPVTLTKRMVIDRPIVIQDQRAYAPLMFTGPGDWTAIEYTGPPGTFAFQFHDLKDATIKGLHLVLRDPAANGFLFKTLGSSSRVTLEHASVQGGDQGFMWDAPNGADMCLWTVRQCWANACHRPFKVSGSNALEFLFSQCAASDGVTGIDLTEGGSGSVIDMLGVSDVLYPVVVKGGYQVRVTSLTTERATTPFTYGGAYGGYGQTCVYHLDINSARDTKGPLAVLNSSGVARIHVDNVKGIRPSIVVTNKNSDLMPDGSRGKPLRLVMSGEPLMVTTLEGKADLVRLY